MELEVSHGATAVRLIKERGVSYAQVPENLGVHPTQLRDWVKKLADDPHYAFLRSGPDEPRATGDARLKCAVIKLKAERDIAKGTDVKFFLLRRSGDLGHVLDVQGAWCLARKVLCLADRSRPNDKCIADFTYAWTAEGWFYVAAAVDLLSRRVVGWSLSGE